MREEKKKILFLMEYPIDLAGGGQESTKTLCEGLCASGRFEPVVACPLLLNTSKSDYAYKINTYRSDENRELSRARRLANFFGRIAAFYRIIKEERPDLIHVTMSESLISFGFLRVLGFFSKIPFVYTDRGLFYGYRKHSMACIRATMKHAYCLITTTNYNANLWKDRIKAPVKVVHNTISSAFDSYDENMRSVMRKRYGIDDDTVVIGFAGRISEEKNWEAVPGFVKALAGSGTVFKVALVMSLYEKGDGEKAAAVKDGIISAVGSQNLIYMQDLDQKEMSDYYYLVDFFIMTSRFESFGKAAVEAMSRKCIVLSTAAGGLPEVIGSEDDLYDMDDLKKPVERIRYLTQNREDAIKERQMFYDRYRDNFTIRQNINGHIRIYDEALKNR